MFAIAILAAGKGTRMRSSYPKVLQQLAGRSLIKRVIKSCEDLKPDRFLVIVGHQAEAVQDHLKELSHLEYINQVPQKGTGHAIQQLLPVLDNFIGDLLVLNGDVPLLKAETLQKLIAKHKTSKASVTFLSARLSNPKGYGRVFSNNQDEVDRIVEDADCSREEKSNKLTNAGIYLFKWDLLKNILPKLSSTNKQSELYLTDAISQLPTAIHLEVDNIDEVSGVNDRAQLANCENLIQQSLRNHWMSKGVSFIDPESCTISEESQFGIDIVIEPQTHLRGNCFIGNNCRLGPSTYIEDSRLGENVNVMQSTLNNCQVASHVKIGPFAHLRPETNVSSNCRIGNFVEIKKSELGQGTKVNHLSYIGDSHVGCHVNIGAGTITANFDGFRKNETVIGDHTKTGANSVLIAPINIGNRVTVGAGSTLTKNVPDGSLAIERSKQNIKENWKTREETNQ
ncbi:bifunctional UDP-N-acetylglucosamine diphosphorylase/glucosamine-1-phosphate N-acetyltransferase GlmU [Prochlorococcus marinus]|uniref:Bifunctional protein GlmU n=1 Tax=Prochlorococcus marinus (strain MIT 9211) TaxID=93059 RepID=GLMU_PROM4|nr:bifunctional UDP-N-acetylglucosamine diphosphorylase/glucosamine-1-phosphate N-acetyltransferase GlmU [Prochlorococcus marinus]A9BAV8.1 RecName: Full=Bifunctional protein GlmU; Includes: RecName: Full=UDP-N-acetylglucosamine pyrophosphorylase; AltName: Full=N-acetylglucosamine-1-phosphate uridyltransferase; Includes: RecName: Full=Glucosamine-1-phosphate N-acetyltransferase [Prochlorococcus marinus str. MIT 9211]ABX08970.1 UDP-N-acetylglucosamine pyrophosphorylase [Prochlorococcus marinus str.